MSTEPTIVQQMLTSTPPAFSGPQVMDIALTHFGIQALGAAPLVSERDQNFRLDSTEGQRFTLKISNRAEREAVVDFQNQALLHIAEQDPTLPIPRVIAALSGAHYCHVTCDGYSYFVRVLSWLDGRVLHNAVADAGLSERMGRLLARLGLALQGFEHPGSNPSSLWDMKRAGGLRQLLPHIEDPGLSAMIGRVLDRFDTCVQPLLPKLRKQVIYSDMNLDNVLLDEADAGRISGLIDFGDLVCSPLVIDPAIAAAYQLSGSDDPLAGALPLLAGYHAVRPLLEHELRLLPDLIMTRLVTSLLIGNHRATLFPDNRDYLLTSFKPAKNALAALGRQAPAQIGDRILDACAKVAL